MPPTSFQQRQAASRLIRLLNDPCPPDPNELTELLAIDQHITNTRSSDGQTPLHFAATHGHLHACHQLIAANASVNATDIANFTPILNLINANRIESVAPESIPDRLHICHLLIAAGANPNHPYHEAFKTIADCANTHDTSIAIALLDAGARLPDDILHEIDLSLQRLSVETLRFFRASTPPRTDIPIQALLCERHLQALALREALPSLAPATLTAASICLLATIDQHHLAFDPDLWSAHPAELHSLLSTLPPWLATDILNHQPQLCTLLQPTAHISGGMLDPVFSSIGRIR